MLGLYRDNENKMETTILYQGQYWGYIGVMEKLLYYIKDNIGVISLGLCYWVCRGFETC